MLVRLTRVLVPSVRASPTAVKPARLGFSPAARVSFASLMKPMHLPPEQLSPVVAGLPSSHASALLRCTQPTAGGVQKSVVQTLASSQFAGVPRQAPRVHVSPTVHTLPSLQGIALKLRKPHAPAPLQALLVQTLAAVQGEPSGSNLHVGEQQSPARVLPSSHCSPASRTPLPQTLIVWPVMVNKFVCTLPGRSPGPFTWKKLVPQGLPVMVWRVSPSPLKPAGGDVSDVRYVEPTGPERATEKRRVR